MRINILNVRFNRYLLLYFSLAVCLNLIYLYSFKDQGLLFTTTQLGEANDLNFMLYRASNPGFELDVTWGSRMVMLGLYISKWLTGSVLSAFIIVPLCNTVLFGRIIRSLKVKAILLPFALGSITYTMIPGKGAYSLMAVLLVINGTCTLRLPRRVLFYVLALFVAFMNRPWEIILLMPFIFSYKQIFFFIVLCLPGVHLIIDGDILELVKFKIQDRSGFILEGITEKIGWILRSDNLILHLILAPVRILAVIISLFTSALTSIKTSFTEDFLTFLYRLLPISLRVFDFVLLSLSFGKLELRNTIVQYIIVYMIFISFFGVEEKSRYFLLFSPLLILTSGNQKILNK